MFEGDGLKGRGGCDEWEEERGENGGKGISAHGRGFVLERAGLEANVHSTGGLLLPLLERKICRRRRAMLKYWLREKEMFEEEEIKNVRIQHQSEPESKRMEAVVRAR